MVRKAIRYFVVAILALSLGQPAYQVGAAELNLSSDYEHSISLEYSGLDDSESQPSDTKADEPARVLPGVLISHVLTGNAEADTHELIEIFNNSDEDVDITGWCVEYIQASGNVRSVCFSSETIGYRVILPARAPVILASDALFNAREGFYRDGVLAYRGLAEESGAVLLRYGEELIDGVAWGDREPVEGSTVASPERGVALERKRLEHNLFQDSNSNIDDFHHLEARQEYVAGAIYEEFDFCLNIPLIQTSLPDGLYRDEATGECLQQPALAINECPGVVISEIAANYDRQFIEFFNQSDQSVNIGGCRVMTNRSDVIYYSLPDKDLMPGQYEVVFIDQTELTLTKTTTGTVYLLSEDGTLEADSRGYTNLKAGSSWSRFGGDWRQTYSVTPGGANIYQQYMPCEEGYYRHEETGRCRKQPEQKALASCPAGKERNPSTNRCRNVVTSSSSLKPCREGQYRNPETNRCRNIESLSSSLVPCKPGQYRNPETNRCKKLETASAALADCGEGRERNPETNRCRNIPSGSVPAADFAAIPVSDSPATMVGWWLFGGTATLAIGYAGWEWRQEVNTGLRKVAAFLISRGK